jgi:site-specific DNA recombinase
MALAIYARVGTDEQPERQSIRTQIEFGERYCRLQSLTADCRPQGSQILKDARHGKFDQLLVCQLDRPGRETRLILNAVAELENPGVRVRSMTGEFDTGTSTGMLMVTMPSSFASDEREFYYRCKVDYPPGE